MGTEPNRVVSFTVSDISKKKKEMEHEQPSQATEAIQVFNCPICSQGTPSDLINQHIDKCLNLQDLNMLGQSKSKIKTKTKQPPTSNTTPSPTNTKTPYSIAAFTTEFFDQSTRAWRANKKALHIKCPTHFTYRQRDVNPKMKKKKNKTDKKKKQKKKKTKRLRAQVYIDLRSSSDEEENAKPSPNAYTKTAIAQHLNKKFKVDSTAVKQDNKPTGAKPPQRQHRKNFPYPHSSSSSLSASHAPFPSSSSRGPHFGFIDRSHPSHPSQAQALQPQLDQLKMRQHVLNAQNMELKQSNEQLMSENQALIANNAELKRENVALRR